MYSFSIRKFLFEYIDFFNPKKCMHISITYVPQNVTNIKETDKNVHMHRSSQWYSQLRSMSLTVGVKYSHLYSYIYLFFGIWTQIFLGQHSVEKWDTTALEQLPL